MSVVEAFKNLDVAAAQDASDYEAIFEVSYKYLQSKDFNDIAAFHNCIVSLIYADKYYKALAFIEQTPEEIHSEFPLEKAYVYYKTGHAALVQKVYDAALKSGDASSVVSRALKHVMAQSHYQNGRISEALGLYHELLAANSVDNELDMACNERAILSQLAMLENDAPVPTTVVSESDKTYDIVFNEALIHLATCNLAASSQLLSTAAKMCLDQNLDSDPQDLAAELAPIKLTAAYVHQLSGNVAEAAKELDLSELASASDAMTKLILKTNSIALAQKPENLNFISRELNLQEHLHHLRLKWTKLQNRVLLKNHLLLSYQSDTISNTSSYFSNKFYAAYAADYPGDITPLLFKVLVALNISEEELQAPELAKAVNKKLFRFGSGQLSSKAGVDLAIAAALLLVHMNSKSGKYEQSILLLEQIAEQELQLETMHGAVFGLLVILYELTGSKKLAELQNTLVEKLVSLKTFSPQMYAFTRAVAFKFSTMGSESSDQLFQKLHQADPTDVLVASAATGDGSQLPPVESLASSEGVEELLKVNIEDLYPQILRPTRVVGVAKKQGKVAKKTSKPRFSATKVLRPESEFDPEKHLDKERWLPMKLRSYYKPSKKDLKKRGGGHQGAIESSPAPQKQQKKKRGKK